MVLTHTEPLAPLLVALGVIAVVRFFATLARRLAGGRVSLDVQYDLRNAIFDTSSASTSPATTSCRPGSSSAAPAPTSG